MPWWREQEAGICVLILTPPLMRAVALDSVLSIPAVSNSGLSPDSPQQSLHFKKDPQEVQMHFKVLETLLRLKNRVIK